MMRTAEFDSTLRVVSFFLCHYFTAYNYKLATITTNVFSLQLYIIWSDLAVSIGAAFILTLCFESPVIALEKIWKVQQPSTVM
jgi:peptidoglycan/LPS O-acetylase OafA/YrhL